MPGNEATEAPEQQPKNEEKGPNASGLPCTLTEWLKHYWNAPREKSKWTDIAIVMLTLGIAAAGFWSAWVFQGQLNEARDETLSASEAFRIDERAWVEISKIGTTIYPPDPPFATTFKFAIYPKNVGKTIAKDVRIHIDNIRTWNGFGENRKAILMFQDQLFRDQKTGKRSMEPNKPSPHAIAPGELSPVPVYSGGQAPKRYRGGFMFTYVLGRIDYTDAFNTKHWVRFCFAVINERGELGYCEYGNEEDNNSGNPN